MARARFSQVMDETKNMPHHFDSIYPAIWDEIKMDFQCMPSQY
jgi:hypothetical protein